MRKPNTVGTRREYKTERNQYVHTRRQEQMNCQKNILAKRNKKPKMFYNYINSKLKRKFGTEQLLTDEVMRDDAERMSEILNKMFQDVLTNETDCIWKEAPTKVPVMERVRMTRWGDQVSWTLENQLDRVKYQDWYLQSVEHNYLS